MVKFLIKTTKACQTIRALKSRSKVGQPVPKAPTTMPLFSKRREVACTQRMALTRTPPPNSSISISTSSSSNLPHRMVNLYPSPKKGKRTTILQPSSLWVTAYPKRSIKPLVPLQPACRRKTAVPNLLRIHSLSKCLRKTRTVQTRWQLLTQ